MLSTVGSCFEDDYEVKEKIGSGSFSDVWLCVQKSTGQERAAKILKKDYGKIMDEASWNSIFEVDVANSMSGHPFLLLTEAAYHVPEFGKVVLITERMGKTLYDLIKNKCILTECQIKIYTYQMLEGLKYLHETGFIHRGIKPENVLLTRHRFLKIGDFGTAVRVAAGQPYEEYVSNLWYRSPECLLTRGRYGTKTDVWAAGCVIFEMATCRPLFPGADGLDQMAKIDAVLGEPEPRLIDRFRKHKSDVFEDRYEVGNAGSKKRATTPGAGLNTVFPPHRPAYEVLKDMIVYDPIKRLSADRLLRKPYFYEMMCTQYEYNLRQFRMSQDVSPYCRKINETHTNSSTSLTEQNMKIQQPSTNKKNGPDGDRTSNFLKCMGQTENVKLCTKNINRESDISWLNDQNRNKSIAYSKYNIGKCFTVQKPVNVNTENEKHNYLSKFNTQNIFSKKTQLMMATSQQTLNKASTTKKIGNSLLNRPPFK